MTNSVSHPGEGDLNIDGGSVEDVKGRADTIQMLLSDGRQMKLHPYGLNHDPNTLTRHRYRDAYRTSISALIISYTLVAW